MKHRPPNPLAADIAAAACALAWRWLVPVGAMLAIAGAVFWFCTSRSPQ